MYEILYHVLAFTVVSIFTLENLNCIGCVCVWWGWDVYVWGACVSVGVGCVCVEGVSSKIIFSGDCWSNYSA